MWSIKTLVAAFKQDAQWINVYTNNDDLTDHGLYVLTIEPDDGYLSPADYVVEGRMSDVTPVVSV